LDPVAPKLLGTSSTLGTLEDRKTLGKRNAINCSHFFDGSDILPMFELFIQAFKLLPNLDEKGLAEQVSIGMPFDYTLLVSKLLHLVEGFPHHLLLHFQFEDCHTLGSGDDFFAESDGTIPQIGQYVFVYFPEIHTMGNGCLKTTTGIGDIVLDVPTGELRDLVVIILVGPLVIVVGIGCVSSLTRRTVFLVVIPIGQTVVVIVKEPSKMFVLSTMRPDIVHNGSL
jgi:hypothetical protein